MKKTGVLLINLGTPDSPKPSDVRKYLLEFLTDGRVIDYPWLPRQLLVRGIIVPFRYRSSAKTYKEIWDAEKGSPLLFHSVSLTEKVREHFSEDVIVELGMRYQSPSIESALDKLRAAEVEHIIILPLFPQYASSSSGTAIQKATDIISTWQGLPSVSTISSFYDHPDFIEAFMQRIRKYDLNDYDHVIFSYHGLPERHMRKVDESGSHCVAEGYSCCERITGVNRFCYRAQCLATTREFVKQLDLADDQYTMSFQSRLGRDPWIQPYTTDVLEHRAEQGDKRLLVVCPAFVADCLETIFEIGEEYQEEFQEFGGDSVQLVESLNDSDAWVNAVVNLIKEKMPSS